MCRHVLVNGTPIRRDGRSTLDDGRRLGVWPEIADHAASARRGGTGIEGTTMGLLDGKVAVITGAGSGMAKASTRVFVREGARARGGGRHQRRLSDRPPTRSAIRSNLPL